jgi:hypothetical protein
LRIGGERNPVGIRVSHGVGKALIDGLRLVGCADATQPRAAGELDAGDEVLPQRDEVIGRQREVARPGAFPGAKVQIRHYDPRAGFADFGIHEPVTITDVRELLTMTTTSWAPRRMRIAGEILGA